MESDKVMIDLTYSHCAWERDRQGHPLGNRTENVTVLTAVRGAPKTIGGYQAQIAGYRNNQGEY